MYYYIIIIIDRSYVDFSVVDAKIVARILCPYKSGIFCKFIHDGITPMEDFRRENVLKCAWLPGAVR